MKLPLILLLVPTLAFSGALETSSPPSAADSLITTSGSDTVIKRNGTIIATITADGITVPKLTTTPNNDRAQEIVYSDDDPNFPLGFYIENQAGAPSVLLKGSNSDCAAIYASSMTVSDLLLNNGDFMSELQLCPGANAKIVFRDSGYGDAVVVRTRGVQSGPLVAVPPSAQTIEAGGTINADACGSIKPITSAGPVTTDTTNTFQSSTADGCCMSVVNVGANTIDLDCNAAFRGDGCGTSVQLGQYDSAHVCETGGVWYMIGPLGPNG